MHYYNEVDPLSIYWLEALIAEKFLPLGEIDSRSITEVKPQDLKGYTQCHFFAGIGGWPLALKFAGISEDISLWTGSCPCQPFSSAGKQEGENDVRHLWPVWFELIRVCKPAILFGEQVASPAGRRWLAGVFGDLEALGYSRAGADLCAAGIGAPHLRQRIYWTGLLDHAFEQRPSRDNSLQARALTPSNSFVAMGDTYTYGQRILGWKVNQTESRAFGYDFDRSSVGTSWRTYDILCCADKKARRIEPGVEPLAHGLPENVGLRGASRLSALCRELVDIETWDQAQQLNSVYARRMRLAGYGNAIVPELAAIFIQEVMQAHCDPKRN